MTAAEGRTETLIIQEIKGKKPDISRASFIADNAVIIGDVVLEEGVSIWYGAVLRGDSGRIHIGRNSNIQDNCVLHCDEGGAVEIGDHVLVGHGAIIHGCTIGAGSMIGMGAIVLNNAVIGPRSLVGAGSLVTERKAFEEESLILGNPARSFQKVTPEHLKMMRAGVEEYISLGKEYSAEQPR